MNKKEFYIIAIIVIFCYLAIIFQVNYKKVVSSESGENINPLDFNAFTIN